MRIALVYLGRHGAGGPISYQLATHLNALTSVFAVISRSADNVAIWRASRIPFIEIETYASPGQVLVSMLDVQRHRYLQERIVQESPDVLFFPMLHTWAPIILWRLRAIPSVVTIHDPEPHPGLVDYASWRWSRLSIRLATRCVVLSAIFVPTLQRLGVPSDRVDVIPLGELSCYRDLSRTSATTYSSAPTILFFGRITPYKGLEVLLEAFMTIERETDARLLIVGAGSLAPYAKMIANLSRIEIVNRWIPDDEVDIYFRQADLVVAPYTSASQSGVVAIATSLGIPVVASRVGGLCDQIDHERTGILVEPASVEDLTNWCLRLIRDPVLAAQLAQQAKRRAQSEFGWPTMAKKVIRSCCLAITAQDCDASHSAAKCP